MGGPDLWKSALSMKRSEGGRSATRLVTRPQPCSEGRRLWSVRPFSIHWPLSKASCCSQNCLVICKWHRGGKEPADSTTPGPDTVPRRASREGKELMVQKGGSEPQPGKPTSGAAACRVQRLEPSPGACTTGSAWPTRVTGPASPDLLRMPARGY